MLDDTTIQRLSSFTSFSRSSWLLPDRLQFSHGFFRIEEAESLRAPRSWGGDDQLVSGRDNGLSYGNRTSASRWRSRRNNGIRGIGDENEPNVCWHRERVWPPQSSSSNSNNNSNKQGNGRTTRRTVTAARTKILLPVLASDLPGPVILVTAIRDRLGHRDLRGLVRSLPLRLPTRRSLPSKRTLSTALLYSLFAPTKNSRWVKQNFFSFLPFFFFFVVLRFESFFILIYLYHLYNSIRMFFFFYPIYIVPYV